jgi:hypothetical protein
MREKRTGTIIFVGSLGGWRCVRTPVVLCTKSDQPFVDRPLIQAFMPLLNGLFEVYMVPVTAIGILTD